MSNNILLITHCNIADSLANIASQILGHKIEGLTSLGIANDSDTEQNKHNAEAAALALGNHDGLLILTDIYGATPSNIANQLLCHSKRRLVSGINLPMLLKAITYRQLPLDELTQKVIVGGQNGIIQGLTESQPGVNSA